MGENMEYSGTWKEIWTQKGDMIGTKDDIAIYDGWEKATTSMEVIAKRITDVIDIKETDSVLEVGCGAGGLARFLNCDYIGIDFSKPLTKKCMEFYNLPAICSEANQIPFKDNYFDKCFSWGVFLYFPSTEYGMQVLDEMERVTKEKDNTRIFVGDIPIASHNERHMIYQKEIFTQKGYAVSKGWADPYIDTRFNAWK